MTRKRIKTVLEWFHVLLILSLIAPIIYMADKRMEPEQLYLMYMAGYLLFVPIVGIMKAGKKCRTFLQYIGITVCVYMVAKIAAQILGEFLLEGMAALIYRICLQINTVLIAVGVYVMRMHRIKRQEAKEKHDSSWAETELALDKPNKSKVLWFVAVYALGINFACPQVCNLALYSSIGYLILAIAYEYIEKIEDYLKMNESLCRVRNIPYKRIYGIGKVFLIGYLFVLTLAIIPAIVTINGREYRDIREGDLQNKHIVQVIPTPQSMWEFPEQIQLEAETVQEGQVPFVLLMVMDIVLYGMAVISSIAIMVVFVIVIHRELKRFAKSAEEEDDVVEALEDSRDELIFFGRKEEYKTEQDRIRRKYRKFIRKHRKELPAVYETPIEIETAAGVAWTAEGKELHEQYELVRYGKYK